MVSLYFGLPGCGKTTLLASMAYKILKAKKPVYKHVLSNVYLGVDPPFDRVTYIENEDLGHFDFRDSLILLDEATIAWDSRDYKRMEKGVIKFFLLHRHYNCDLVLFTQQW